MFAAEGERINAKKKKNKKKQKKKLKWTGSNTMQDCRARGLLGFEHDLYTEMEGVSGYPPVGAWGIYIPEQNKEHVLFFF